MMEKTKSMISEVDAMERNNLIYRHSISLRSIIKNFMKEVGADDFKCKKYFMELSFVTDVKYSNCGNLYIIQGFAPKPNSFTEYVKTYTSIPVHLIDETDDNKLKEYIADYIRTDIIYELRKQQYKLNLLKSLIEKGDCI